MLLNRVLTVVEACHPALVGECGDQRVGCHEEKLIDSSCISTKSVLHLYRQAARCWAAVSQRSQGGRCQPF